MYLQYNLLHIYKENKIVLTVNIVTTVTSPSIIVYPIYQSKYCVSSETVISRIRKKKQKTKGEVIIGTVRLTLCRKVKLRTFCYCETPPHYVYVCVRACVCMCVRV